MKTKAKKFSHKLLALFLALVMGITCFSGVLTSYAASTDTGYVDDDVEYNDIAWNVLSDEQLATAILDYADEMLPSLVKYETTIYNLLNGESGMTIYETTGLEINIVHNLSDRQLEVYLVIIGISTKAATITFKLGSVDELIETVNSVNDALDGIISTAAGVADLGLIEDIDLSALDGMSRSTTSSCDIVRGVLGLIYDNNNSIIGELLRGDFTLGVIDDAFNIYDIVGDLFDAPSGYESNFVYNLVQSIIFKYTDWYTDDEIAAFQDGSETFVFDEELLGKMTTELLDKINVRVTYADGTNSKSRLAEIEAEMESSGSDYATAAAALGYDPDLVYSDESYGNVLLFAYGSDQIELTTDDSLFSFGYQALKYAWNTVLKDTLQLVHVNYSVERGHGTNFDNVYYYWAKENITWDQSDMASNYSEANVLAWAESAYESYGAESADEFLTWVEEDYEFDRTVADDAEGLWSDIDATTLFNKLRYSPLADYYFDMQTGPINLYFMQTGTSNLDAFFEEYCAGTYDSLAGGLNDALVAAVKDIFVDSDNVYTDAKGDTSLPTMATTNPTGEIGTSEITTITNTLVSNALEIVQYVADTTDQNILNGFYMTYGEDTALTESNLEEAMIPLLITCINEISISGNQLKEMIHPDDWDMCKDAEAVMFVALREYLSYALPNKDYNTLLTNYADYSAGTATEYDVSFEETVMPMARDALIYVIEPYVPVTYNGERWTADTTDIADSSVTIFDLFNEIMCYYADDYTGTDWKNANRSSDETALGAASLLGICDSDGNSLINTDNDLWTNLDLAINTLLPVVGTLQGNGYGQADSYSLIYEDIIMGILDIGTLNENTQMGGVSNFIYRLLTIVCSEPIQTTSIVITVYDVLKDLINALFGPRYDGQEWTPVPDATSTHPFDDLFQVGELAGTSDSPGAVIKLINNFIEFSGFGYNGVSTYPDSILAGLTFAVSAVNSFFNFLPVVGDHALGMATMEFEDDTVTALTSGDNYTTNLVVTNNSTGINTAYLDIDDEVQQMSRYYIQPVSVTVVSGEGTELTVNQPSSDLVAPGDSYSFSVTTTYTPDADETCSYEATLTYNITDENGDVLYSDISTVAYQYMTSAAGWYETMYPDDRVEDSIRRFPTALENDSANQTMTSDGVTAYTTAAFSSSTRLVAGYPASIVVDTTNLALTDTMGFRIRNTSNSVFGGSASIDGIYIYDEGTVLTNDLSTAATEYTTDTSSVTVSSANAIPIFDKETGDLIRYGLYDISYDGGTTWDRTGIDESSVNSILSELDDTSNVEVRTHVAYTLQEALDAGIIAAYYINSSGYYEHIYLTSSGSVTYETTLAAISMRGPVDGYYINSEKVTVSKASSTYITFLMYDGETDVQAGVYDLNINFYSANNNYGLASIEFIVTDTSDSDALDSAYETVATTLANYLPEDFVDYDGSSSAIYDEAKASLVSALAAKATPLSVDAAKRFIDNTVLAETTTVTTSATGDVAYRPYIQGDNDDTLPNSIKYDAYVGGSTVAGVTYGGVTGVYYFDANCTMPIYNTTEPLTSEYVTNGCDEAGVAVTEVDGTYYLTNEPYYETEWDLTTYEYPYQVSTGVQATDSDGNLLYEQITYVYRDSTGTKVNSTENPVCKFPATEYKIIENTDGTENRGLYQCVIDLLTYELEQLEGAIDSSTASLLLSDVSLVRQGLNENNFDIITYNKMVDKAKDIEDQYDIYFEYSVEETAYDDNGNITYDSEGNALTETVTYSLTTGYSTYAKYVSNSAYTVDEDSVEVISTLSSIQVYQYIDEFNTYLSYVQERGYIGDQLEAEIVCASNGEYTDYTVTEATYDEDGNVTANATVAATTVTPEFGAYVDGVLENSGDIIYPTTLWNNYVNALATAVALAQYGNGDYPYATSDYYVAEDKDSYTAQVTNCYTADTNLQIAEIALENTDVVAVSTNGLAVTVNDDAVVTDSANLALTSDAYATFTAAASTDEYEFVGFTVDGEDVDVADLVLNDDGSYSYSFKVTTSAEVAAVYEAASSSDTITISGVMHIANSATGNDSGFVLKSDELNIYADGVLVGTTNSDGTFSVDVPAGTTELTVSGASTIARTVTISADCTGASDVIIPIVICDYNNDLYVNANDLSTFFTYNGSTYVFADFNADGYVNANDLSVFLRIYGNKVAYDALTAE